MPCYRCGARQTDPIRGASPWLRGVRAERQVLVCPGCQADPDWTARDLDACDHCGSTALVSRLGEIECRTCAHVRPAAPAPDPPTPSTPGLSEEVAAALTRVLKRGPVG